MAALTEAQDKAGPPSAMLPYLISSITGNPHHPHLPLGQPQLGAHEDEGYVGNGCVQMPAPAGQSPPST